MGSRHALVKVWTWILISHPSVSMSLKFDGVKLNIYGLCWGQSFLENGIAQWEKETGAKIFSKWTCSAHELEEEVTSDLRSGANFYDAYICTNKMVPLWASQGWLKDLTDEMREKPELGWAEILPLFRDIVATYGQRIYTVPWDGDVFLTYFRRDLAARDGWPAPDTWTWEEFISIAQKYDGQDLNGDGVADYGACLASAEIANSFYHYIVPFLTMAQALGERQGVFLNLTANGIAPSVDNAAFRKAIEILRASHGSYPIGRTYAEARTDFTNGRCAIYFTWPSGGPMSIKTIDSNGTKVYIHGRMGVAGLPGSRQVLDWQTGNLVECSPDRCPYAINPVTKVYDGINRISWYANGGMGAVVNAGSSAQRQEAVVEFAMWYAKNVDVTLPSPYNPFRENHFNVSNYIRSGWDPQDAQQYVDAELEVLGMENLVLDFRVPGIKDFFMAYSMHYLELLQGNQSVLDQSINQITQNVWDFIHGFGDIVRNPMLPGQLELERIYREGIGLPMRVLIQNCQPGTGYVENQAGVGSCANCSAGWWGPGGANQVCLLCAPGSYERNIGSSACSRCIAGRFSGLGESDCTSCPSGTAPGLAGQATCPCEQGRYGNGSMCSACPSPLTTELIGAPDESACVCPRDFYKPMDHRGDVCLPCGKGLECAVNSLEANIPTSANTSAVAMVGSYPKVLPSYFTWYYAPLATYKCLSEKACPGGHPEECGLHRTGLACGTCESGHFMSDGQCERCSEVHKSWILFPILPAVLGPLVVVVLYRAGRNDVEAWQSSASALSAVVVLCLAFTQTIAVLRSFYVVKPGHLHTSWAWTDGTLNIFAMARSECADFGDFTTSFIGKILVPVYAAAIFIATWAVSKLTCLRMDGNIVFSSYAQVFNAVYISIAAQALSLFQCYDHPGGRGASLRGAASVLCHETEWNSLVVVAIAAILLFCVFSIALYSFVIWISLDYIRDKPFRMRWKFLLAKFRPTTLKWTVILLVKGLWINLASVIFRTPERQLIWLSLGMLMYFAGALFVMPWRIYSVALLDVAIHGLLLSIFCIYPFLLETSLNNAAEVGTIVIAAFYCGYVACLGFAGRFLYHLCGKHTERDWTQTAKELCELFQQINGREEWLAEIFERVPWVESHNLLQMGQVLQAEMRGGQYGSLVGTSFHRPSKLEVMNQQARRQSQRLSSSLARLSRGGSMEFKRNSTNRSRRKSNNVVRSDSTVEPKAQAELPALKETSPMPLSTSEYPTLLTTGGEDQRTSCGETHV